MLQLKEIRKSYKMENFSQVALDNINLSFRKSEFVAILGPSGSGKTTCLNILGGLDRYDEGDLIINKKSTKDFRDSDWDAYRNNSVGFIFQNYNLIPHLNLIDNVEMGMTLSGLSFKEKRAKTLEVLERVGLKDHIYKKPTQLSGGQMQRVAIARALANDPDIILADEPTGALDTKTSKQIMELIKEIAQDKLVIMVTHNPDLAEAYADRIVRFQDGSVTFDSNPNTIVPDIILTDTPTNDLSSKSDEQIIELVKQIVDYVGGQLIVRITKNPTLPEQPDDRMIHYDDGNAVFDSNPSLNNSHITTSREPDIILTDTPTSDLSTKSDEQIIELVKQVVDYVDDQLTIRITKNPTLPLQPDDRIINYSNGKVIDTTHSNTNSNGGNRSKALQRDSETEYELKRTSMGYFTALKLSGKNIAMKKWRTVLTMLALSIGLIGVAIVLALSNGFSRELATFEAEALMDMPISIFEEAIDWDQVGLFTINDGDVALEYRTDRDVVYINRPEEMDHIHRNLMTDELFAHLDELNPDYVRSITHTYRMSLNLLREVDDEIINVNLETSSTMTSGATLGLPTLPQPFNEEDESLLYRTHELLYGQYPTEITDLVLIVDEFNRVNVTVLEGLGFDVEDLESLNFADFVGLELRLIPNNDFYILTDQGNFVMNSDMQALYESENAITLTITGVFRQKDDDATMQLFFPGILHSDELTRDIVAREIESDIVQAQLEADYNVLTLATQTEEEQRMQLNFLGGRVEPVSINIFPYPTFEAKDAIIEHLDAFNEEITDDIYRIVYEDQASVMSNALGEVLTITTIILVAFSAISLVVSLVMIAIITYISVMERTKEIGILRALGARKKDITRIFIAEVIIIGFLSGAFSIGATYLLSIPINAIIYFMNGMRNVSSLSLVHGIILVLLSLALTIIAGFIPARIAAKKDPVEALRAE